MTKRALLVALFVVCVHSTRAQLADTPWPTLQHDLQRTGRTSVVGPQTSSLLWRIQLEGYSISGIALAPDGTIYLGDRAGIIYGLNPDGTEKWRFQTGSTIHSAGPTVAADGTVYIASADTFVYALNADGSQKWRFATEYHTYGTPVIDDDGTIYFGNRDTHIYAVDRDGNEVWRYGDEETYYFAASPALGHDGRLYTPGYFDMSNLFCHDRDGTPIWQSPANSSFSTSAIDERGVILTYGYGAGTVVATNLDGTRRWVTEVGRYNLGSPAISSSGTTYVNGSRLNAVSPEGVVLWTTPQDASGSPVVDGLGTIYVGGGERGVRAFDSTGIQKWWFETPGRTESTKFAIGAEGVLYFADQDGWFYALRDPTAPAAITDFEVTHGQRVAGGLVALSDSDDSYMVFASHPFHQVTEPNRSVWILGGFTNVESPELMDVKIEVRLSLPGGVCKVAFRNFDTGQFEPHGEFATTTEDKTHFFTGVPTGRFVREDGRIEMEVKTVIVEAISESTFRSYFDEVRIEVRDYSGGP